MYSDYDDDRDPRDYDHDFDDIETRVKILFMMVQLIMSQLMSQLIMSKLIMSQLTMIRLVITTLAVRRSIDMSVYYIISWTECYMMDMDRHTTNISVYYRI
jgi:hypothetical protein